MKALNTVAQPIQFPKFWDEDWLKIAIDELDSRKMTPDEKASLEILIARNAESVKAENRKIEAARMADKIETIKNLLGLGILTNKQIAKTVGVNESLVMQLAANA